ncbi:MAG: CPBP family intramembrane metalloprotease [Butyrivibrio sp.]|nr:CPBP family intramembrane metalloprotease [Butyrivibrio sp.]
MDYKRANRTYLYMIIATLALVLLISYYYAVTGRSLSIFMDNLLCELVILLPTLAVVLFSGEKISHVIPMRGIKPASMALTVVYLLALFPLVTCVNYISMFFVENMVSSISDEVLAMPMWMMILSMGLIGPFIEEIVFRGVIFHSYKKTGRIVGSIILSSVLFGMMHLNFNQFAYGAVMGVMFCLLVEATGSVLTSFIAHALFNTIEVIVMYTASGTVGEADVVVENVVGDHSIWVLLTFYFVVAVVFTAAALYIVRKIADIQGRTDYYNYIRKSEKQGYKLITVPLVIAVMISVAYMCFVAYISNYTY